MSVELRVLRYVLAVADEGGFQRAAERLHIAQPPLSRQIATLERDLGVRLFDRRPTRLTEAGVVFVESARRVLAEVDHLVRATRRVAAVGRVSVGYIASASYETFPTLLAGVHAEYPDIQIGGREGWSPELEIALHDRRLDLVLSHSIAASPSLDRLVLRREPMAVIISQDHPLAGRDELWLRDLHGETFCFLERALAPRYHDLVLAAVQRDGHDFPVWEHPLPGLRHSPLRGNTGFTVVSASAGRQLGPGLACLRLRDDLPAIELELVWKRDAVTAPTERVLDAAQEIARTQGWLR